MPTGKPEILQGTLDLLVLKALTWGPMHGYGVSVLIHQQTDGEITVVDAALYKALYRLEHDNLLPMSAGDRRAE